MASKKAPATTRCIRCKTVIAFVRSEIGAKYVIHHYEPCPKCGGPDGQIMSFHRHQEDADLLRRGIEALCAGDKEAARKVLDEHKRRNRRAPAKPETRGKKK